MTNLESLQSMLEYKNDDLLMKALTDRSVNYAATYTKAGQKLVEMAAADIYLILTSHPTFKENSRFIDYSKKALLSLRREILRKWDELPSDDTITTPGIGNATTNPAAW